MEPDFQQRVCACLARVGKAFANGHRLSLLRHLSQGERSVENLARLACLTVANTSQHLQHLRNAGLVESRKAGQNVFYRLSEAAHIVQMLDLIESLAVARLHEAHRLMDDLGLPAAAREPEQIRRVLDQAVGGRLLLLDLRLPEEYAAGALPGAVNVPFATLAEWVAQHTPGPVLWLYGRGPCCEEAALAERRLRAAGLEAYNLGIGVPQARLQGLMPTVGAEADSAAA